MIFQVRTTEANSLYEMDKATQVKAVVLVDDWSLEIWDLCFVLQAFDMSCILQEVVNAIVEAQSCGLGLAMNKISLGPNLPTISFTV